MGGVYPRKSRAICLMLLFINYLLKFIFCLLLNKTVIEKKNLKIFHRLNKAILVLGKM